MKFLNVFCKHRNADVYVNLEKIVLIRSVDNGCQVEFEDSHYKPVEVAMTAEELVRKINGEDKVAIGFRTGK